MKVLLRSTEENLYEGLAEKRTNPHEIRFKKTQPGIDPDEATNDCMAKIMDDFYIFLESLAALKIMRKEAGIKVDHDITSKEDLLKYVNEYIEKKSLEIAKDQGVRVKDKIDILAVSDETKEALVGYNDYRICVTHHRGIAKKDFCLVYKKLTLLVNGSPIEGMSFVVKDGGKIGYEISIQNKYFKKDEKVRLTEEEVNAIASTLTSSIGPEYIKAAVNELS